VALGFLHQYGEKKKKNSPQSTTPTSIDKKVIVVLYVMRTHQEGEVIPSQKKGKRRRMEKLRSFEPYLARLGKNVNQS